MLNDIDKGDALFQVLDHYQWGIHTQRSGWVSVRCGAHDDRHASCRVNFDIGQVKCMACPLHGDVYDIIQHYEGCDFAHAVAIAKAIVGDSGTGLRGADRRREGLPARSGLDPSRRRYKASRRLRGSTDRA